MSARSRTTSTFPSCIPPAGSIPTAKELLLLTDDGALPARISSPRFKLAKVYWAQVEGLPTEDAVATLRNEVDLGDFVALPAGRGLSISLKTSGRRTHRFATAPRYRPHGSSSPCAGKEPTGAQDDCARGVPDTATGEEPSIENVRVEGLALGEWREIDVAAL